MCGVFALISPDHPLRGSARAAERACTRMSRRGPDGAGFIQSQQAILGHRRLSIIDAEGGQQPMMFDDGKHAISFNGEIFNYRELREELENYGHHFTTSSDTETLLRAYLQYGANCLSRLRGMFAFIVTNLETGETFAARDRQGIKPLYYAHIDGQWIFASEMAPIYETGLVKFEPNEKKFNEFLVFGYIAGSETLHRHIYELEPGHFLRLNRNGCEIRQYWQPVTQNDFSGSYEEAIEQLAQLFPEAINAWMESDVEIGSLLSGGIDSSLVTAIAHDIHPGIKSYSLVFPDHPEIDESKHIKALVSHLGVENRRITGASDFILKHLQELVGHFDEPILDPNNFSLMDACHTIRERTDLKVILCGEGADELFGGYARHRILTDEYAANPDDRLLVLGLNRVALPRLQRIAGSDNIDLHTRMEIAASLRSTCPLNKVLEYDQLTFLGTRLHSQDRVGMYYSLEVRTPFLDHHLVECVNSLPPAWKISEDWSKFILRSYAARMIPETVAWEKKKTGLSIPYSTMLSDGPLNNVFTRMMCPGSRISDFYDINGVLSLFNEHRPYTEVDHSNTLWRLLAIEMWLQSRDYSTQGAC